MPRLPLAVLTLALFLPGCVTNVTESLPPPPPRDQIRPILAVGEFENRSSFGGQWSLGPGVADLLLSEIIASKHFVVVEREKLDQLVAELRNQRSEYFRPEGRIPAGRLKNAGYYVRGVITDFTQISNRNLHGATPSFLLGGSGYTARVALVLTIVEVESGEVIESVNADATASAGGVYGEGEYKDVRFGGDAFFRTPLGIATRNAIRRGLKKIITAVPKDGWRPRIAAMEGGRVIVTGGREQGQKVGAEYDVLAADKVIQDPKTGDTIDTLPGEVVGRLRIVELRDRTAIAEIVRGINFEPGQQLRSVMR